MQACKSAVQYMRKSIKLIQECLHGKNAENVLVELGVRFHRVVYDHLCQYTYNSAGTSFRHIGCGNFHYAKHF